MTEFLDSNIVKLIGLIASLIAIIGIAQWRRHRKTKVINNVTNSTIDGNFTGVKSKGATDSTTKVENKIKGSKIKGNFTGSSEN